MIYDLILNLWLGVCIFYIGCYFGYKITLRKHKQTLKEYEEYCNTIHKDMMCYCEFLSNEYKKFINDVTDENYFQIDESKLLENYNVDDDELN